MMIEDFGARVASVWDGLRPTTRSLVERALVSATTIPPPQMSSATGIGTPYDARAEWELSRLLAALDERATEQGANALSVEQSHKLTRMTETCALMLRNQARSAEVFAQLLERALRAHDFARVDELADMLVSRVAPSENCEMARHANPAVRAIAQEGLLLRPTSVLVEMLGDPVDAEVARDALQRQADELESEEACWIVNALRRAEASEDDF
ncbi:MAG TPA: hypothetical protein VF666_01445 [Pyrinomonadaceae bacterium]|jgi:hypothetical protein